MKGRTPSAAEKRHMEKVRALGCIVCRQQGYDLWPEGTEIHHTRGKTQKGAHYDVLPLCHEHHSRYSKTGFHYNPTEFQKKHGTQAELLEKVENLLNAIKT